MDETMQLLSFSIVIELYSLGKNSYLYLLKDEELWAFIEVTKCRLDWGLFVVVFWQGPTGVAEVLGVSLLWRPAFQIIECEKNG